MMTEITRMKIEISRNRQLRNLVKQLEWELQMNQDQADPFILLTQQNWRRDV